MTRRRKILLAASASTLGLSSFAVSMAVVAPSLPAHAAAVAPVVTDNCGYNQATFNEDELTKWLEVFGSGLSAKVGVFSIDESGILLGVGSSVTPYAPFDASGKLGTALTHGTNATQIDVDAPGLPVAVAVGDHIVVDNGPNSVTFTANAVAAAGAPSISVTSHAVGTHDYAAHTSTVTDSDQTVPYNHHASPNIGSLSAVDAGNRPMYPALFVTKVSAMTLAAALTSGTSPTTILVSSVPEALTNGEQLVLQSGSNAFAFTMTATQAITASPATLHVSMPFALNFSYPVGSAVVQGVGDWQSGGTAANHVDDVFGTWATASIVGGNYTVVKPTTQNDWHIGTASDLINLGADDPSTGVPASTFGSFGLDKFGNEMRWNANNLVDHLGHALAPGGTYRIQVLTHDGDQNKGNGDAGEFCTTLAIPGKANPTLATTASGNANAGDTVSDSATLSSFSGTVTGESISFSLYPTLADCQAGTNAVTGSPVTATMNVNGVTPQSGTITVSNPGAYYWQASYGGDGNNNSASSDCTTEKIGVDSLSTSDSGSGSVGGSYTDSATLNGAQGTVTGETVSFSLYPSLADCQAGTNAVTGSPVTATLAANGTTPQSSGITVNSAGTYFWQASYAGDANNHAAKSDCSTEQIGVGLANPSLDTTDSGNGTVGGSFTDSATLSNFQGNVSGQLISFSLYPSLNDCLAGTNAVAGSPVTAAMNANGVTPQSPGITVNTAGTYYWQASYGGLTNVNNPATSSCRTEQITVGLAQPSLTTTDSGGGLAGSSFTDSATLHNFQGNVSGQSISFSLYPTLADCQAGTNAVAGSPVTAAMNANGVTPQSPGITVNAPGTYFWQASYGGLTNVNSAASSDCTTEQITVTARPVKASPTISTNATAAAQVNNAISDTATLANGNNPTGTITFNLYGPNDNTCSNASVFTTTVNVSGNGTYSAGTGFTPTADGAYNWTASYSGDNNNNPVTEGCGGQNETTTVTALPPPAGLNIVKTGPALAHVGDTLDYTLVVTSTSTTPVTDVVVTDPLCDSAPVLVSQTPAASTTLGPGDIWTYTCSHTVTASDPDPFVNTAFAVGSNASQVQDDATTDIIHPAITITKTASPASAVIGDTVTYTYVVKNSGDVTLTDVVVTDDKLGTIGTIGTMTAGQTVTLTKSIVVTAAGAVTNIGTAAGADPLGTIVKATDNASIAIVAGEQIVKPPKKTPQLPFTGFNTSNMVLDGVVLILAGGLLLLVRRRRRAS